MTNHIYLIRGVTPCSLGSNCQLLGKHNAVIVNLFSNLEKKKTVRLVELLAAFRKGHAFLFFFHTE
jgi:hypothetical protein